MKLFTSRKQETINYLTKELIKSRQRNRELEKLCKIKDDYFMEMISDGLRHGSKLAAKHMAERNAYLKGL